MRLLLLPNFEILTANALNVVIRDVGPWGKYQTITNAAEEIVKDLTQRCMLRNGVRLFYYDSEGEFGELLHKDNRFTGFADAETHEVRS